MTRVLGIDLGTTNSVVATLEKGKAEVIRNAEGQPTTPSVVGYTDTGNLLVGNLAKRQAVINPENTFFLAKRFMGRRVDEVTEKFSNLPYEVDLGSGPLVKFKCPALGKSVTPQEISSQILRKLAKDATTYLNEPATKVVISVPAYFNDSQRQATRDAGKIAGLEVLRIVNEPTAAALAYGLEKKDNEDIVVFDLGGGTFDVSILAVGEGAFEVMATAGDAYLGGSDIDASIVQWLIEDFKKVNGVDLTVDKQALQRIIEASEAAKIALSTLEQTTIDLPFITQMTTDPSVKHLKKDLTREMLEEMCKDFFKRCHEPVQSAFKSAERDPASIDRVILVGGTTRIPAVECLAKKIFEKEPDKSINPDEIVAMGAAIQAAIVEGSITDVALVDVTPISLGIETLGGLTTTIIERNTILPKIETRVFTTATDDQTTVKVTVIQGERPIAADNKKLGVFMLDGIKPAVQQRPEIAVSFDIDKNGILSVTAKDKETGNSQAIKISDAANLSQQEVDTILEEAKQAADEDEKKATKLELLATGKTALYSAQKLLADPTNNGGPTLSGELLETLKNTTAKLEKALTEENLEDIRKLLQELGTLTATAADADVVDVG
jgi:molecular chaperone DnaK